VTDRYSMFAMLQEIPCGDGVVLFNVVLFY